MSSGRSCAQQVCALQDGRYGGSLDGGGRDKTRFFCSVGKGGGQTKGGKRHGGSATQRPQMEAAIVTALAQRP